MLGRNKSQSSSHDVLNRLDLAEADPYQPMAGLEWITALEHVLAHLSLPDVQALRLTARALRAHPAVLALSLKASLPADLSRHQHQAGLCFLQQLPKLCSLTLQDARSLWGVHQLSQLRGLEIRRCQQVLDFYHLGQLPLLKYLIVKGCPADRLGSLSEMTQLTSLEISQVSFQSQVPLLTGLRSLQVDKGLSLHVENFPSYASLTGLTSLNDNVLSQRHWHKLPCLQYLEVNSVTQELGAIAALTNLCGLALCLGRPGTGPTSLNILTALSLRRLELFKRALAVPALPTLTRLSINFRHTEAFPDLAPLPALSQLYLSPHGPLTLPDLPSGDFPSLTRIFFQNAQRQLMVSAHLASRCSLQPVQYMPWIDEDT